ncbi:hypothetical protein [Streptomyces sp. NBC_01637]|uniref:hypothetical protein n=1 Tax=unclassified Streptomyces TaxID=2593676 RepID=UPI0038664AA7|nr:hypothetical protein OH719_13055 [Streptomyces sp. NBC_01653]WTD92159.1 hypothetical protein OG891_33815 [Streptomyces sp. NBC_01637]
MRAEYARATEQWGETDVVGGAREGLRQSAGAARRVRAFGLLLVLVSGVLFALVPLAERDNRAYAAAPDCPVGTRSGTCRAAVVATVTDKNTDFSGKTRRYFFTLRYTDRPEGAEHRVRMAGSLQVYDSVRRGDRVTGIYWNDELRAIRFGSLTEDIYRSPVHDGRLPGAFAVAALASGLGLLSYWWWRRYRPTPEGATQPWEPIAGLVAGLVLALGGFPIVLMGPDDGDGGTSLKVMAWATGPILLLIVLWSWWPVRRGVPKAAGVAPPSGSA